MQTEKGFPESSQVEHACYLTQEKTLEVTFKKGGCYQYLNVPPATWNDLLAADSIGTFLNDHIKGVYQFTKVS